MKKALLFLMAGVFCIVSLCGCGEKEQAPKGKFSVKVIWDWTTDTSSVVFKSGSEQAVLCFDQIRKLAIFAQNRLERCSECNGIYLKDEMAEITKQNLHGAPGYSTFFYCFDCCGARLEEITAEQEALGGR